MLINRSVRRRNGKVEIVPDNYKLEPGETIVGGITKLYEHEIKTMCEDFNNQLGAEKEKILNRLKIYNEEISKMGLIVMPITEITKNQTLQLETIHQKNYDPLLGTGRVNKDDNSGTLAGQLWTTKGLAYLLVIDKSENVIGYISFNNSIVDRITETPTECYYDLNDKIEKVTPGLYVMQVATDKDKHRKGVGKVIYNAIANLFPHLPITSHVNNLNIQSFKFHVKFGFRAIAEKLDKNNPFGIDNYITYVMWCDSLYTRSMDNNK